MTKKKVEFDARSTVMRPTEGAFKTKSGKKVAFVAAKATKVPVHVKFKAKGD